MFMLMTDGIMPVLEYDMLDTVSCLKSLILIKKTPPDGVVVSMIFGIENHGNPSHYDLHIKNFNSDELKFLIEYQYESVFSLSKQEAYNVARNHDTSANSITIY